MSDPHLTRSTSSNGLSFLSSGSSSTTSGCLFIPGWGCRATDYNPLITSLLTSHDTSSSSLRYISLDMPGHGSTPKSSSPTPTITHWGKLIIDLAHELNLTSIIIVGHSMGCRPVLAAASTTSPTTPKIRIKALILLDGSNYSLRASLFAFDTADPRSATLTEAEKQTKREEAFTRMFSARTPAEFQKETITHIRTLDHVYHNQLRQSCVKWDAENMDSELRRLGDTKTPLLVIQSTDVDAQNQRIPLPATQDSKWMAFVRERVPAETLHMVVVRESGHFPHVDQTDVVAGEVWKFARKTGLVP